MSDANNSEPIKLTITLETTKSGAVIDVDGAASIYAMAGLKMVIARHLSSNLNDGNDNEIIILQGQIVNLTLRLAKMMGHKEEILISSDGRATKRDAAVFDDMIANPPVIVEEQTR